MNFAHCVTPGSGKTTFAKLFGEASEEGEVEMFPAKAISFDQVLPLEEQKNLATRCDTHYTLNISLVFSHCLLLNCFTMNSLREGGGQKKLPL